MHYDCYYVWLLDDSHTHTYTNTWGKEECQLLTDVYQDENTTANTHTSTLVYFHVKNQVIP